MKVVANYSDYWMRYADGQGPVLTLDTNGGPNKREQFSLLKAAGFLTPPVGPVEEVLGTYWEEEKCWVKAVVAYTDEMSHCGEGKELWWKQCSALNIQSKMGYDEGNEKAYKNHKVFCSAFVENPYAQKGCSIRRLQIGPHCFWIEYRSDTDWRSNVGEGDTFVIGVDFDSKDNPFGNSYPLWAVDFVLGKEMFAIDLNTAAGIGHTLNKYISNEEICRVIESCVK